MPENPSATLQGTVEKIISSSVPGTPEKAQISVESADHLYRELRVDNSLETDTGEEIRLKVGSPVEITITAEAGSTTTQSNPPEPTTK